MKDFFFYIRWRRASRRRSVCSTRSQRDWNLSANRRSVSGSLVFSSDDLQQKLVPGVDRPRHAPMQAILRRGLSVGSPRRHLSRICVPVRARVPVGTIRKRLRNVHEPQFSSTPRLRRRPSETCDLLLIHYVGKSILYQLSNRPSLPRAWPAGVPCPTFVVVRRVWPDDYEAGKIRVVCDCREARLNWYTYGIFKKKKFVRILYILLWCFLKHWALGACKFSNVREGNNSC